MLAVWVGLVLGPDEGGGRFVVDGVESLEMVISNSSVSLW